MSKKHCSAAKPTLGERGSPQWWQWDPKRDGPALERGCFPLGPRPGPSDASTGQGGLVAIVSVCGSLNLGRRGGALQIGWSQ